jgi:hypothetical protein
MEQTPELNPTRTWCLGRFLINLPPTAKLYLRTETSLSAPTKIISGEYGGGWKYRFAKIEMPPEKMSLQEFEKKMRARQDKLRKAEHREKKGRLLQTEHPQQDTYVLATWEEEISRVKKIIEGYRWSGGYVLFLRAQVDDDKQASGVKTMLERLSNLRARATDEIPEEEGYCFPGGFIAEELEHNEEGQMSFVLDEYPDISFDVTFFPTFDIQEPLLSRRSGVLAALGSAAAGIRTLRSGDRPLAGFPGQELLMTTPHRYSDRRSQVFLWEYPGDATLEEPFIKFELTTGDDEPTRMTDEQAIALWDAILNSFKVRPVKANKPEAKAEFPHLIASGDKCPRSGHWRCVEDGGVYSFTVGQIMPNAHYSKPATGVWSWIRGKKKEYSHDGAGHWEWVDVASNEPPSDSPSNNPDAPDTPTPESQS